MTENHQRAHDLFFHTNLNQKQIAEILGVNRKTLYTWIKQGSWIRARYVAGQAPILLAEQYYTQLMALNNEIMEREKPFPTREEAEVIRKLTITADRVRSDRQTCAQSIELFTHFTNVLMEKDLDLARKVVVHMDQYVKDISESGRFLKKHKQLNEEAEAEKEYEEWLNSHFAPGTPDTTVAPAGNGVHNGASQNSTDPAEPAAGNTSVEKDNTKLSTKPIVEQGYSPRHPAHDRRRKWPGFTRNSRSRKKKR